MRERAAASFKQQETETEIETTSTAAIIETETEIKTQVNVIQETTTEIKIEITTIAETTKTTDAIIEEIISLTNNIRVAAGVDKVTYDPVLTEMAQVRAAEENAAIIGLKLRMKNILDQMAEQLVLLLLNLISMDILEKIWVGIKARPQK